LSFKEQKEMDTLEKEITELEIAIKELNTKLNSGKIDNSTIIEPLKNRRSE